MNSLNTYYRQKKVNRTWRTFLPKQNYSKLATIYPASMKNKYMFEENFRKLSNSFNINKLFYSVEKNIDFSGYHIHLMMDTKSINRKVLAHQLGIKQSQVTYLESIKSKKAISNYVTKYMKGDMLHYNIY